MMFRISLFFLFLLFQTILFAAEKKTEVNESLEEFKTSKYLQLDSFDIPNELKVIENQIAQNSIDVIILNGKHTVSYSQKRNDGYSKSYKNFYGLKVTIFPIKEHENEFLLKLFYYNWTTRKFDKTLSKKISKYNVLNELRFALYELFMGAQYVHANKDKLEKDNFERIGAVRKMVEDQERLAKQKAKKKIILNEQEQKEEGKENENKLKRDEKKEEGKNEKVLNEVSDTDIATTKNELADNSFHDDNLTPEREARDSLKDDNTIGLKAKKKKKIQTDEAYPKDLTIPPIPSEDELAKLVTTTPKYIDFNLAVGLRFDTVVSKALIETNTNLKYLNLGASYTLNYASKYPWGYQLNMNAGIPIKKEKYNITVARSGEMMAFKSFLSSVKLGAGIEYSSLTFANLPGAGEGIKVVQNDILYTKLFLSASLKAFERSLEIGGDYGTSVSNSSNVSREISIVKRNLYLKTQLHDGHGLQISYAQSSFSGYFTGKSNSLALLYIYNFGN